MANRRKEYPQVKINVEVNIALIMHNITIYSYLILEHGYWYLN